MYVIKSRYQHYTMFDGVQWTKWFTPIFAGKTEFDSEADAKAKCKEIEKKNKDIDKLVKLKTEYKYEKVS